MPDLYVIATPRRKPRNVLHIELKREKGGSLSEAQKKVIPLLNSVTPYVRAVCCRGYEEAKEAILQSVGISEYREE